VLPTPGSRIRDRRVEPWLRRFLPYFTDAERKLGYQYQLFVSEVEYCHNVVFRQGAALDRLFNRLLDGRRGLAHPQKVAIIFGRKQFYPDTRTGRLEVKISKCKTPVPRTEFQKTSAKPYVRSRRLLRTETTCYQVNDLSIRKDIKHLPTLREVLGQRNERLLEAQQDVLASYVDRGQLERLRQPTVSATGRRTPGLRLVDSIREFGFRQPIVVDEDCVIVVGHTRYKAALRLGLESVPVHVASGLTPAQIKAYRLADNQTAILSSWDDDKIACQQTGRRGFVLELDPLYCDVIVERWQAFTGEKVQ
jgi:hypothetical protein